MVGFVPEPMMTYYGRVSDYYGKVSDYCGDVRYCHEVPLYQMAPRWLHLKRYDASIECHSAPIRDRGDPCEYY